MPVFYKTITGGIAASDFVVYASGKEVEPLACEINGCKNRAYHAFATNDATGPGKHHPRCILLCDEHAIQFAEEHRR